jgi:Protein of unknown function (DUF2877)
VPSRPSDATSPAGNDGARAAGVASLAIRELVGGRRRDGRVIGLANETVFVEFPGAPGEPRVVAISTPATIRLPNALITAAAAAARAGDPVHAGGGCVTVAGVAIRALRWWDPVPVVRPLSRARLDHGAAALARVCVQSHQPGLAGHPGPAALAACCASGDLAGAVEQAEALVGLGPGIIPAGDGVLCGLLLALRLLGGAIPGGTRAVWLAGWLSAAVTTYARERTIPLGASLLHCAARGQAVAEVASVLHGVAGEEPLEPATRKFLDATPWAADVAWGLVAGCQVARVVSVS